MKHSYDRYLKIIEHFRKNPPDGVFCERHHIIPLSKGGTDTLDNVIVIPAKAHIICHYLLHKAFPDDSSLAFAFSMMCVNNKHQDRKFSGRLYERSKIARSNAMRGKPRPEWVKEKLRKPKYSNKNYLGNKNQKPKGYKLDKPRTEAHQEKLNLALKSHYEARKEKTRLKRIEVRQLFIAENIPRKEFYKKYSGKYKCIKEHLTGL